jgi:hypothetical protein
VAFDFNSLRQRTNLSSLNEAASKFKSGGFAKDERYWQPEIDKAGEGGALLRFMPAPDGEEVPFVRKFSYGFKGPTGRWFIENCPSTIDKPSPILEYNSELWNTGLEENKEIARRQKRKLGFVTNIQVIKHKARPSDEGKVFLWEFGKKIWDKVNAQMNPDEEDVDPVNPFCLWTGGSFRLRIKNVAGFRNYDDSAFDAPKPLSDDNATLEKVWRQCYSLQAEVAPDKFKSYDELKKKFYSIINAKPGASQEEQATRQMKEETRTDESLPWDDQGKTGAASDDLEFFRNMANGR